MNAKKALKTFALNVAAVVGISAGILLDLNLEDIAHKKIDKDYKVHPVEMAQAHKHQEVIGVGD